MPNRPHISCTSLIQLVTALKQWRFAKPLCAQTDTLWAMTDQGLFAVSNLGLSVAMARWLTPEDFGLYTIGFNALLFLGVAHTALFSEPMLTFGPGKNGWITGVYIRILTRLHWLSTVPICLLIFLLSWAAYSSNPSILHTTIAFSLATPALLFQWLMRKAAYINSKPVWAAQAGAIYLLCVAVLSTLAHIEGATNIIGYCMILGASSLLSGYRVYNAITFGSLTVDRRQVVQTIREHWEYGRWALGAGVAGFFSGQAVFFLLPIFQSVTATGELRALSNTIMPAYLAIQAFCPLLRPLLVRAKSDNSFTVLFRMWSLRLICVTTGYWLVVGICHSPLLHLLYSGKFGEHGSWLWVYGVNPIVGAFAEMLATALGANEEPSKIFRANMTSFVAVVPLAVVLIPRLGLGGAAITMVVGNVFRIALMLPHAPWERRSPSCITLPSGPEINIEAV